MKQSKEGERMIKKAKVIFFLTTITFLAAMIFGEKTANGETLTPPVPEKNKVLPANDGGPDGCDSSRFKCVMGGEAVLDKQTGIIWSQDGNLAKKGVPWQEAEIFCQNVEIGNTKGWRLPTREELIALLDPSQSYPALPKGHPFKNVGSPKGQRHYWTSNDYESDSNSAWVVCSRGGSVEGSLKLFDYGVWPVRDSN
jgi:hypothetical protein